jgi:hypothetical protein
MFYIMHNFFQNQSFIYPGLPSRSPLMLHLVCTYMWFNERFPLILRAVRTYMWFNERFPLILRAVRTYMRFNERFPLILRAVRTYMWFNERFPLTLRAVRTYMRFKKRFQSVPKLKWNCVDWVLWFRVLVHWSRGYGWKWDLISRCGCGGRDG